MRWRREWRQRLEYALATAALVALLVSLGWRDLARAELPVPLHRLTHWASLGLSWLALLALAARRIRPDRAAFVRGALVAGATLYLSLHREVQLCWTVDHDLATGWHWLALSLVFARGERRSMVAAALLVMALTVVDGATGITAAVSNCDCSCIPPMWAKGYGELAPAVVVSAALLAFAGLHASWTSRREGRPAEALTYLAVGSLAIGVAGAYWLAGEAGIAIAFETHRDRLPWLGVAGKAWEVGLVTALGFLAVLMTLAPGFGPRARGARRTLRHLAPLLALTAVIAWLGQRPVPLTQLQVSGLEPPTWARSGGAPYNARQLRLEATGRLGTQHGSSRTEPEWSSSPPPILLFADAAAPLEDLHAALDAVLSRADELWLATAGGPGCCSRSVDLDSPAPDWVFLRALDPRVALGSLPIRRLPLEPPPEEARCRLPPAADASLAEALRAIPPNCEVLYVDPEPAPPLASALLVPSTVEPHSVPQRRTPPAGPFLWGLLGGLLAILVLVGAELRPLSGKRALGPTAGSRHGPIRPRWLLPSEATHCWSSDRHWSYRESPRRTLRGAPSRRAALRALGRRVISLIAFWARTVLWTALTFAAALGLLALLSLG